MQLNMEQPMRNARVRQLALGQLHLDRRTKEDPITNNTTLKQPLSMNSCRTHPIAHSQQPCLTHQRRPPTTMKFIQHALLHQDPTQTLPAYIRR
mmetsp:Transcript_7112/g.10451  ORF Transcript_7112/g.10451 Transcript_7112/m.10451 type:complete len:94 (+) Transcript_7112:53-334(+)